MNFHPRQQQQLVVDTEEGPSYYGLASSARRESCDVDGRAGEVSSSSYVNDDLADEVEAIRLAADFASRKLLGEQKRDRRESLAVTPASASRMRIRAILDKQKTLKVISPDISQSAVEILSFQEDEEKSRREKRESQDISKFLWVYR